jgi:hypothetical protein
VFTAEDRGAGARYRGRSGSGLAYEARGASVFGGRFAKRDVFGTRIRAGPGALGLLAGGRTAQGSVSLDTEDRSAELAFDPRGRWRAEAALTDAIGETRVSLRIRGGPRRVPLARRTRTRRGFTHARRVRDSRAGVRTGERVRRAVGVARGTGWSTRGA